MLANLKKLFFTSSRAIYSSVLPTVPTQSIISVSGHLRYQQRWQYVAAFIAIRVFASKTICKHFGLNSLE